MSSDEYFQIHIKREPNAYFINNYFTEGLIAWKANNHYKAVT